MIPSDLPVWLIIIAIGIGTYLIRLSFLGLVGAQDLPPWLLRLLRYTPVAVLPGLVAPLIVLAGDGPGPDPMRLIAAAITLLVGYLTKSLLAAFAAAAAYLLIASLVS